jgi:Xaa-Pro aminopeptidase
LESDFKKDFDSSFDIPIEEYSQRVKKVQKELVKRNIDVAFAIGTPFVPGDVQYLSGYDTQCPENSSIFVVSPTKSYLCVGPEGFEYAKEMRKFGELINLTELKIEFEEYPYSKFRDLKDILHDAAGTKIKRVGKLTFDSFTPIFVSSIFLKNVNDEFEFVDATDILYEMRWIKSDNEIELLRTSFKICTEATKRIMEEIKPGRTELEIAAIADYVFQNMGCNSFCFDQIVLSGERTNTIVGRASEKVIERGDPVTFFINGRYKGYSSHMSRILVAGGISKEQSDYYEHGYKAFEISLENFRLGNKGKELDVKAREYYKKVGLDIYQNYSFCHGAGLHESNEGKASNKYAEWVIPKNILMMINVGLYNHPKFYGYALEDGAIINNKGETELLTDLPIKVQS